jgi:hydroxypyruvate isomerase
MRSIPHSLQVNINSALFHSQKSHGQIASELDCTKATISRLAKKINPDRGESEPLKDREAQSGLQPKRVMS